MATDHEQRRRRIATIAIDLIARQGLGAATIRNIAEAGHMSTAAITHYFLDKRELLLWTFDFLSKRGEEQFSEAMRAAPDDVSGVLMTMVAWCPVNVTRWKAYLAFWDEAARDAPLAARLAASTAEGLAMIEQLVTAHAPAGTDSAKAARLLNAVIQGTSLQAIVSPESWPSEVVRETVGEAFAMAVALARGEALAVR
jgi:AcrR family transcriptional regulator